MNIAQAITINNLHRPAMITLDGHLITIKYDQKIFKGISFTGLFNENNEQEILDDYSLTATIPLQLQTKQTTLATIMNVDMDISRQKENFHFRLRFDGVTCQTTTDNFEQALVTLQQQIGSSAKILCCLSCKFSSYNPYGSDSFGTLYCLYAIRKQYSQATDKSMLLQIFEKYASTRQINSVQETHLCSQYSAISKDDWIYSNWQPQEL